MKRKNVGLGSFDVELPDKPEFTGSVMGWTHPGLEGVLVADTVGVSLTFLVTSCKVLGVHISYV